MRKCFTTATGVIPILIISARKNLRNRGFRKKPLNKSVHFYLTRSVGRGTQNHMHHSIGVI
jgi:hypothetical protein